MENDNKIVKFKVRRSNCNFSIVDLNHKLNIEVLRVQLDVIKSERIEIARKNDVKDSQESNLVTKLHICKTQLLENFYKNQALEIQEFIPNSNFNAILIQFSILINIKQLHTLWRTSLTHISSVNINQERRIQRFFWELKAKCKNFIHRRAKQDLWGKLEEELKESIKKLLEKFKNTKIYHILFHQHKIWILFLHLNIISCNFVILR